MRNIGPIADLQQQTKKYVDRVRTTGLPIVITERGRAAAILSSAEDLEGVLITLDEMSYPDWQVRLRRAMKESEAGAGIEFANFLRKEKKRKHRA